MFAHLDGNNFYVSCQRVFDPKLNGRAVIVLSNNDGCVIARSEEAKALGIKMGTPYFKVADLEAEAGLITLSANFTLIGDMSERMMSLAAPMGSAIEIYSVDECFLDMTGVPEATRRARVIRDRILRGIGIPTCIGLAGTKTLAKLANRVAKDSERKPGSYPAHLQRVCNFAELAPGELQQIMEATEVGDVWGIGSKISARLIDMGVANAWQLSNMSVPLARQQFGVVVERTIRELQGIPCIELETAPPAKQQIACTRSFGKPVTAIEPLIEAVSHFAQRAAEKLRKQEYRAGAIYVFAHSSRFRPNDEPFSACATVQLTKPSSDTAVIVDAAMRGIKRIYQPGFRLSKAGVMLLDLSPLTTEQASLLGFDEAPAPVRDRSALMETMDRLNQRYGKGCVTIGSAASTGMWAMRQERRTACYTTQLDDIPIARA